MVPSSRPWLTRCALARVHMRPCEDVRPRLASRPGNSKWWVESYQAEKTVEKGAGCTEVGLLCQPLIWLMTCHLAHPYGSHRIGTSRAFSEASAHTLPCWSFHPWG